MTAIVCVDKNWAIGRDNALLFHISADLKRFKALTTGKTVVMGKNTLLSLPGAKPLPDRRNLVVSTTMAPREGVEVARSIEEAAERATIIQYLLSDAGQIAVWPALRRPLTPGKALYFSHGFGITFGDRTGIVPPDGVDVILVAPKGSGTSLRRMFLQGRGLNSSYAVYRDATGRAFERVVALGIGVGSGYLFETDFRREVYSDLTGERGTLMGAIQGLFAAQYETLREQGHTPSEAFNETVEELTQSLMPLIAEKGMDWMYANCSTTAQRGALDWWKRFRDATKPLFGELYASVAAGREAQIAIEANSRPDYRERLEEELRELRESEMWQAGAVVRKLRPENN